MHAAPYLDDVPAVQDLEHPGVTVPFQDALVPIAGLARDGDGVVLGTTPL